MRKIFLIIFIFLSLALSFNKTAYGQVSSAVPKNLNIIKENRVQVLQQFFKKFDSPLANFSEDFIAAADFYNIDWRLLPAISGVESTFGKQMISGTYNAYGWGGGIIRFESWSDGIWTISSALKEKYIDKGADSIYKIGRIYCPPNPLWASKVQGFMDKIEATTSLTPNL
jgi:hypothetical protein